MLIPGRERELRLHFVIGLWTTPLTCWFTTKWAYAFTWYIRWHLCLPHDNMWRLEQGWFWKDSLCITILWDFQIIGTKGAALRELAVRCHFIHPELKLLWVGLSTPVVPTYTASLAFVRKTLGILQRVVAVLPPWELFLERSSACFLPPDHALHPDLTVLQF